MNPDGTIYRDVILDFFLLTYAVTTCMYVPFRWSLLTYVRYLDTFGSLMKVIFMQPNLHHAFQYVCACREAFQISTAGSCGERSKLHIQKIIA
jgi:hypothetical protein